MREPASSCRLEVVPSPSLVGVPVWARREATRGKGQRGHLCRELHGRREEDGQVGGSSVALEAAVSRGSWRLGGWCLCQMHK